MPRTHDWPGRFGINLQEKDTLLDPRWATKTESLILNESERLACRGGFNIVSTDGANGEVLRAHIYIDADGDETIITSQADRIVSGIADLDDASTDITSTTTPTNGFWQFVNFNGKVLGFQAGHTPIVKTTGDFADISASAGTLPDGDVACAAYGRVWAVDDDRQTVRYCALLDETDWSTASGGGSIDMRNVWTDGMDYVTGIVAFGGALVIFGRRHIVMYTDGQGSVLGIDPTQMYVVDTIEGTGCISRDTIAAIGEGDLVFLSAHGLQSLARVIAEKSNPLNTISWQIEDRLKEAIQVELEGQSDPKLDVRGFTGSYISETGQYWLIHNYGSIEDVYVFQMTSRTQDEQGRELVPIMFWDTAVLTNFRNIFETNEKLIYATGGATHEIYSYDIDDNTDEGSAGISVDFESGWIYDEDPTTKTLKFGQVTMLNLDQVSSATTFKYATDYQATLDTLAAPASSDGRIVNLYDPLGDVEGQYFKIGISDSGFGGKVLQQVKLYLEGGNIAFIHQKFDDYTTPQALEDAGPITDEPYLIEEPYDVPITETDTPDDTDDEVDIAVPPEAEYDGVVVVVVMDRGQASRTLAVNYGGIGDVTLHPIDAGFSASTQNCVYVGYIPIAPSDWPLANSKAVLTWSSAPSGDEYRIKIYKINSASTSASETNTDSVDGQALDGGGGDNTLDVSLTTSYDQSMVFLVNVVNPESGTDPYTVTYDVSNLVREDTIYFSGAAKRVQCQIWIARNQSNSTDLSGEITVTIPSANNAGGGMYAFEVPSA